jgi:pantetheine-phosphate adenylyltransferase
MRRVAIYPGSFDPPTLGHLDVIVRASKLFDEVIVAVGMNPSKSPLLTVEQRVDGLRRSISASGDIWVDKFGGLLVDYARRQGACAIIRGLRATADFEYEFQMAMVNRRLEAEIESVFLMTNWEYSYLSSSIVKEVALLGGDVTGMVSPAVAEIVKQALSSRAEN